MSNQLNSQQETDDLTREESYLSSAVQEAEKIVDDIFSELDNLLDERDFEVVTESVEKAKVEDHISYEQDIAPLPLEAELLSEIVPHQEEIIEQRYFDSTAFAEQEVLQEKIGLIRHFDKLLFIGSFGFLVTVLAWLVNADKLKFPVFVNQNQAVVGSSHGLSADQEFANYVLQSLKIIEQEKSLVSDIPYTINKPQLGENTPAAHNSNPVNPGPRIIERIYVPFYQQAPTPPPPQVTPSPVTSNQTVSLPPQNNKTPVVQKPVTQNFPSPITTPPPPPILQQTQTPPAITENKLDGETTEVASNAMGDRHTVVGLIELGDRSAALFEINGVTRRIYVGESIGQSGWSLESVNGDQIKVSKNGQGRSLSVGQQL